MDVPPLLSTGATVRPRHGANRLAIPPASEIGVVGAPRCSLWTDHQGRCNGIILRMTIEALREDLVLEAQLLGHPFTFNTTWGLFSPKAVDEGTRLLLEKLEIHEDDIALDLGCGYGPLGLAIAKAAPRGRVHMLDRDFVAIDYAQGNARRNGIDNAEIYLSNGFSAVPEDLALDLVVSNLPAKVGNEMFRLMFHDAHLRMKPGARIVVVTVNGLRDFVKKSFRQTFGNSNKVKQGRTHTVTSAIKE